MSDQFLTLVDLTALQGGDSAVGVVNLIRTAAPEINELMGRPINGTHARISRVKQLPKGNTATGGSFRGVGEGVATAAPKTEQILVESFYFDVQLEVDEAIVKGQPGDQPEDVLSLHTRLQATQNAIELGGQMYKGTDLSAKGFHGLSQLVDDSMTTIKGSATGNACESAYLIRNTIDGVHFVFGNGVGLQQGQWMRQRVTKDGKHYFAWVNNVSGYIGLANNHPLSICRIGNLDNSGTSGKFLTQNMIAQAYYRFPRGYPPTHLLISRRQAYWYQQSKLPVTQGNLTGWMPRADVENYPETVMKDVKVIVTDSITLDEAAI